MNTKETKKAKERPEEIVIRSRRRSRPPGEGRDRLTTTATITVDEETGARLLTSLLSIGVGKQPQLAYASSGM
jgi:hypothetical protein